MANRERGAGHRGHGHDKGADVLPRTGARDRDSRPPPPRPQAPPRGAHPRRRPPEEQDRDARDAVEVPED